MAPIFDERKLFHPDPAYAIIISTKRSYMSKQTNFRLSKTKNNILYILSGTTLVLFAGLTLFPTISESTHAEGDEPDDGITITVNGEVDANLVLFDEGDYKIAKDTVSVSSSAPYGYELFLTTDSEAHQSIYLNDDPTSESRIAPVSGTIAEPATLTDNTWGFAIAGQGNFDNEYDPSNPDPASRFAIIPTADDQQAVFENNAATAEDNVDFCYGIKVEPTLTPGEYKTSVEYTAIAKEKPITAKAIYSENQNLNFVYDRNDYEVGETYTDNVGETTILGVYPVPMNLSCDRPPADTLAMSLPPWGKIAKDAWGRYYGPARTINFDSSFSNVKPMSTCYWFASQKHLVEITNLRNLNTTNVTNMTGMFESGSSLGAGVVLDIDLRELNTSNVTNMSYMFYRFAREPNEATIDIRGWDTSKVTDMTSMFEDVLHFGVDWEILGISELKTDNVISMKKMFSDAGYANNRPNNTFDLDLSGWNTSRVEDMSEMFQRAGYLASTFRLNLAGWNTGNVTNMNSMFYNAGFKSAAWDIGDIHAWDVEKVSNHANFINLNDGQTNTAVVNNQPNWPN